MKRPCRWLLLAGALLVLLGQLGGCENKPASMKGQPPDTSTAPGTLTLPGGKTLPAN
jgi:hypothetical protein